MSARDADDLLLGDVLVDGARGDIRTALLDGMLQDVRQHRRVRRVVRAAVAVLAAAVAISLGWRGWWKRGEEGCPVIHTQSLAAKAIVRTGAFGVTTVVASERFAAIVRTEAAKEKLRWLNDRELLALAGTRPAMLIRVGPEKEKLIFLDELAPVGTSD
jgi:hypothetical protein